MVNKIFLTDNLSLVSGDMFLSEMQTITITVNTVGVMGKGIALTAKNRFPDMYLKYKELCQNRVLKMGKPYLYKSESLKQQLLLFPTKTHWRNISDINGIKDGLEWLVNHYQDECIESLAIPALGCGLGRLRWSSVGPIMCSFLKQLDIPIEIYLPTEQDIPKEQLEPDFLLQ